MQWMKISYSLQNPIFYILLNSYNFTKVIYYIRNGRPRRSERRNRALEWIPWSKGLILYTFDIRKTCAEGHPRETWTEGVRGPNINKPQVTRDEERNGKGEPVEPMWTRESCVLSIGCSHDLLTHIHLKKEPLFTVRPIDELWFYQLFNSVSH